MHPTLRTFTGPLRWEEGRAGENDPVMTKSLPLIFTAPRRGRPPTHLAALGPQARRDAVVAAGAPAFRADQLARHYFTNLTRDPAQMTDLPAAGRAEFVDALLPELLTEVRSISCDDGDTRKTLWRAHDGTLIESVLMRYRTGALCACPVRPSAAWPARSVPPGRAGCSGTWRRPKSSSRSGSPPGRR